MYIREILRETKSINTLRPQFVFFNSFSLKVCSNTSHYVCVTSSLEKNMSPLPLPSPNQVLTVQENRRRCRLFRLSTEKCMWHVEDVMMTGGKENKTSHIQRAVSLLWSFDTDWPDSYEPEFECCAFHGEGMNESVTVRNWFAINRTKTKNKKIN